MDGIKLLNYTIDLSKGGAVAWLTIVVKIAKTGTLAVTPSAIGISLRRTKLRKMNTGSISTVRKGGDAECLI